MTGLPPTKVDAVFVPEGDMRGVWLRASSPLDPRQSKRMIEMVAGRERVMFHEVFACTLQDERASLYTTIRTATEEEWLFLIGMCVVEQAERLEL